MHLPRLNGGLSLQLQSKPCPPSHLLTARGSSSSCSSSWFFDNGIRQHSSVALSAWLFPQYFCTISLPASCGSPGPLDLVIILFAPPPLFSSPQWEYLVRRCWWGYHTVASPPCQEAEAGIARHWSLDRTTQGRMWRPIHCLQYSFFILSSSPPSCRCKRCRPVLHHHS